MGKTEKAAKSGDVRLTAEARKAFGSALRCGDIDIAVRKIAQFLARSPYEEYRVAGYSRATGKPKAYTWVRDDRGWDGMMGPFYLAEEDDDESPLLYALKARLKEGQLMVIRVGSVDNYVFEHVAAAHGDIPAYFRLRKSV